MLPNLQQEFNKNIFSQRRYEELLRRLNSRLDMQIQYRVAEMPAFLSKEFQRQVEEAAVEILIQSSKADVVADCLTYADSAALTPRMNDKPLFGVIDFAVTKTADGEFVPKLVELQGFPSVYGYQYIWFDEFRQVYPEYRDFSGLLGGLSEEGYIALLRTAIFGDVAPEHVALLEYQPKKQKTRPDFESLRVLLGLKSVDICDVYKKGSELWYRDGEGEHQLKRIFNRAIHDELVEVKAHLSFSWNDDLEVEWAGNPNWYFGISKSSMIHLSHSSVPRSIIATTYADVPKDLNNWVLKPLHSFAGKGVNLHPTADDVRQITEEDLCHFAFQERIEYAECLPTPEGDNKVEVRVMLVWLDNQPKPTAAISLVRTGRGPMMGVRYNSEPWTGSTGCLLQAQ